MEEHSTQDTIQKHTPLYRRFFRMLARIGLGEEKQYFVENISLMLGSGIGIAETLSSIKEELKSKEMKRLVGEVEEKVSSGRPLWAALQETGILPTRVTTLIRIGERSGNLSEYLRVISQSERKHRLFSSKIRGAVFYPVFIFCVTLAVGTGVAWFILPRLAEVFGSLAVELPISTRALIRFGEIMQTYGEYIVPALVIVVVSLIYFVFFFTKSRFVGQFILFHIPGIGRLYRQVELARFGYLLGTLLGKGIPLADSFESLIDAANAYQYKRLYIHLKNRMLEGVSIENALKEYSPVHALIPRSIQSLIIAASKSGNLSVALKMIGENFEEQTEGTMKNLTVIIEPVLLFVVAVGVLFVALSVILPLYSLLGGING